MLAFFHAVGLSITKGITDTSAEETEIKRQMLKTAGKKVWLCDSSKF